MSWQQRREALTIIFEWLMSYGESWYRNETDKPLDHVQQVVASHYSTMTRREVEELRNGAHKNELDFAPQVILIRPPVGENRALAVLQCSCSQVGGTTRCALYYGLWFMMTEWEGMKAVKGQSAPVFMGYRFESPEHGTNHNYYHAQPCTAIGPRGTQPAQHALNISSRYPTWPLAAGNEVQLLLCLVVSLYGFNGLRECQRHVEGGVRTRNHPVLKEAFGAMNAISH